MSIKKITSAFALTIIFTLTSGHLHPASAVQIKVRRGEGLSHLAKRAGCSDYASANRWQSIALQNNISSWRNFSLRTGQEVEVQCGGANNIILANYAVQQPLVTPTTFGWPVDNNRGVITQYVHGTHHGVDIADRYSPSLVASASGVVTSTKWEKGGAGCAVRIRFDNGFSALYGHTLCNYKVIPTQHVNAGDILVTMGSTGNSTGTHVHFELYDQRGRYVNPLLYIRR